MRRLLRLLRARLAAPLRQTRQKAPPSVARSSLFHLRMETRHRAQYQALRASLADKDR